MPAAFRIQDCDSDAACDFAAQKKLAAAPRRFASRSDALL
jgi:hypothetical protein